MSNSTSNVAAVKAELIGQSIVLVGCDISLWSGRRALKADKLQAYSHSNIALPPASLASLGSVKLVDPKELNSFDKLKDETYRVLASRGLKIFGGYAVPQTDFDALMIELEEIKARFEGLKNDVLHTLDAKISDWVSDWVKKNPDNKHLLQNLPTGQSVFGKLKFEIFSFKIAPPTGTGDEADTNYVEKMHGLRGELYSSVAKEATVLMTDYLVTESGSKRDYVTQKTLRPIKRMAERLRQFAFLDDAAGVLADMVDKTLAEVPSDGRVEGQALISVWSMARMLANPEEAISIASLAHKSSLEEAWLVATTTEASTAAAELTFEATSKAVVQEDLVVHDDQQELQPTVPTVSVQPTAAKPTATTAFVGAGLLF